MNSRTNPKFLLPWIAATMSLLCLCPTEGAANPQRQPKIFGLILSYKHAPSPRELEEIHSVHKKFQLQVTKRLKHFNIELLKHPTFKTLTPDQANAFCQEYEKKKLVQKCSADSEALPTLEAPLPCPPQGNHLPLKDSNLSVIQQLCPQDCKLFDPVKKSLSLDGTFSPLWAQEYVGADLAKEALREIPESRSVPLGVFDDFSNGPHGKICRSLATGLTPFSMSEKGVPTEHDGRVASAYLDAVDQILEKQTKDKNYRAPKVILNAMTWAANNPHIPLALKKLEGTIIVTATGNAFPASVETEKTKLDGLILVGSASPYGLPSEFSQEDEKVTIAAPSDHFLESEFGSFDGTSGATALVAGALLNVVSLLPDLTPKQAGILLKKTALPSFQAFEEPQRNGAGLLNSYQLVEVAKRILSQCKETPDFKACQASKIEDPQIYDFSDVRDQGLLQKLGQHFPKCETEKRPIPDTEKQLYCRSCDDQKAFLKTLRRQALLNPEIKENWQALACIHQQQGLTAHADFYSHLVGPAERQALVQKVFREKNSKTRQSACRGAASLGAEGLVLLKAAIKDEKFEIRAMAARIASRLGNPGFPIVEAAMKDEDSIVRIAAARATHQLGAPGLGLLEIAFKDKDLYVRQAAVKSAGLMGEKGLPFLKRAMKDREVSVRQEATRAAGRLGKPGLPLIQIAMQGDLLLRQTAVRASAELGEIGMPILQLGMKDEERWVREATAEVAAELGSKGIPILEFLMKDEEEFIRRYATELLAELRANPL